VTSYFSLEPLGSGTAEIENFHSYFYRFAALHSTTMTPMARMLAEWWNSSNSDHVTLNSVYLYKGNRLPLCGYGEVIREYLKVVSTAAHQPSLYKTTLLPIRSAVDAVAHGALRRGRAWCPACMYWSERDKTPHYDRLIWTIAAMERCPEHKVYLVSHCPSCGVQQLSFHPRDGLAVCAKCDSSLVQPPRSWTRSPRPAFGESDCISLVRAIADGSLTEAVPKAFQIFSEELRAISEPITTFRNDKSLKGSPRTWRVKYGKPTVTTMLKRCQISGVRLVDVLTDPWGAAHAAGEFAFKAYGIPATTKPRRSTDVLADARRSLIDALADPSNRLDSFSAFSQKLGVSQGFLRYRFRALSKIYIEEHERQRVQEAKRVKRKARDYLSSGGAFLKYLMGDFPSQDHLVDDLSSSCLVQKHVARLLVKNAVARHLKLKAIAKKSRLTSNERIMLARGRKDGYI
jgi:hypothetical protein